LQNWNHAMFQTAMLVLALSGPMTGPPQDSPAISAGEATTTSEDAKSESASGSTKRPDSKTEKRKRVAKIVLDTKAEKEAYRAKYKTLARASFSSKKPNPGIVVPQLVNVFNELRYVEGLQKSELARMRKTLRVRMESLRLRLKQDIAKANRIAKSPTLQLNARVAEAKRIARTGEVASRPVKKRDSIDSLLDESKTESPSRTAVATTAAESKIPQPLAATEQQNAQALINLIEQTVGAGTWESQGGGGSIYYYAPLHALVIRQTDEVHRQIGGVLGNLNQ
jgi:hypothetical protein